MRDNSVRQMASEPFAYYATRDLRPGDEVSLPLPLPLTLTLT